MRTPACVQLVEEALEVVDAEVEHEGLGAVAEVGGLLGEGGKDGHAGGFGSVEGERPPSWAGMPRWVAYHAARALGSRALRKTPPKPTALAISNPP